MKAKAKPPLKHKMNGMEAKFAKEVLNRWLGVSLNSWEFEPIKLRLGNDWKTTYTPDFFCLTLRGEIQVYETKGFRRPSAMVKLKVAAKQYPWFWWYLVEREKGEWKITEIV